MPGSGSAAAEPDVTWSSARAAAQAVRDAALVAAEQPAFTYLGGRDETGFSTAPRTRRCARPPTWRSSRRASPGEGGSHVIAMRWVHDLDAFDRLPAGEQELVIGRTKAGQHRAGRRAKPPTAHIARVEIDVDGQELEIFRRSVPFGTVAEHGLYFVAFSADRRRYDRMLARMFGIDARRRRPRPLDRLFAAGRAAPTTSRPR